MRLTLHEADRNSDGVIGSGQSYSYIVGGLPAEEKAKIAFISDAWRILRWNNAWHGNWTGKYDTPEEALDALREELLTSAA